jgi:dihydrofolate reductase
MRKVVLSAAISLDGYIARPDGSVDFLSMPPAKGFSMAPFMARIDIAILGRKSFDAAVKMGGSFGGSAMKFYVASHTQPPGERDGVTFIGQSPAAFVRQIRKRPGKDIWLMGGGELARDYLKADLVAEIHLGVIPVLLGAGIPLFPAGFPQRDFSLVECKAYSNGVIALEYKRAGAKSNRKS